jgi:hypothetical protein
MTRLAAALVTLAALAAPAAAAPDPFETFIANVATNPKAAAASLSKCKLVLAPSGEARTPCALSLADFGGAGTTLKVARLKYGDVPQSMVEYVDADVEARAGGKLVATYHVIAVAGGTPDDGFAPAAIHVARLISDKDATAKAKAKQLPAAPAIKDATAPAPKGMEEQEQSDRANGLESLTNWLQGQLDRGRIADLASSGGVVFGSAPGQKYTGKAAGKGIEKWKLDLAQKGGITADGTGTVVFAATDIVGTLPDKTTITYAVLAVGAVHMIPGSGDMVWDTKLASFAVPQ